MSNEKKVFKLGLVGLVRGSTFMGFQEHLMAGHISFTGVCERDPKVLEEMKTKLPKETVVYDNVDDLINSGIDAIILCDFFHEHWKLAIKALDAGITVFSETTAAPSLGACVDLVEAVERNNGKYMLLANCPFFKGLNIAKQKLCDNQYGRLIYGDAEYVHPVDTSKRPAIDKENLHWRQTLPPSYYNMHSLGPVMYVSDSVPKRVIGKPVKQEIIGKLTDASKMFVITEMDNGAVFNSTGCVGVGTLGKWYRFVCEKGTMETERFTECPDKLVCAGIDDGTELINPSLVKSGVITKEEYETFSYHLDNAPKTGHGACDHVMYIHMLRFLKGEEEPFFDVYRSVALSAAGILAWYSALQDGKQLDIPDFRNPEEREKVRGDYRMPFAKKYCYLTLPCRVDKDGIEC